LQIERHWNLFASPELTLEKLQMIATSNASPKYKVMWIRWMNASAPTREARCFPTRPVNEDKLMIFWQRRVGMLGYEFYFDLFLFYQMCMTNEEKVLISKVVDL